MERPENAVPEEKADKAAPSAEAMQPEGDEIQITHATSGETIEAPVSELEENKEEKDGNKSGETASEAEADVETSENLVPDENDDLAPDEEIKEDGVTLEALLERLKEMDAKDPGEYNGEDIRRIRQHFLSLRKIEMARALDDWTEGGNLAEDFVDCDAGLEEQANALISSLKEKKLRWAAELEKQKNANLERKNQIIEEILSLAADTDNVNRTFQRYRELQDEFNTLGEVPATEETAVWKRFADAREKYSDNLKINKELRDYDFKKNLELKQLLIAEVEKLAQEEDVIVAYRRLQELHNKWRQIGPVAKEIREEIWEKFRNYSSEINKRHQAHFEERKAREAENEAGKLAICEKVEALDFSSLDTFAAWDAMTKQILDAQNEWKQYGFASRRVNNSLFSRFRAVCDRFFTAKAGYYQKSREEFAANLAAKLALCEKAEALKDSTEWGKTAEEIRNLQKEWKGIGAVARKQSENLWKRFHTACDHFFEQRKKAGSGARRAELDNLKAKREIIEELSAINEEMPKDEVVGRLRDLQDRWKSIGHVPFKEKDRIYDDYRARLNDIRVMFDLRESRLRMERFNNSLATLEGDGQKLNRERDRLLRIAEAKRMELRTLENNLCFLSSKSKSGESMLREFSRKLDRLKADIAEIEDKIKVLDTKVEQ